MTMPAADASPLFAFGDGPGPLALVRARFEPRKPDSAGIKAANILVKLGSGGLEVAGSMRGQVPEALDDLGSHYLVGRMVLLCLDVLVEDGLQARPAGPAEEL